MPRRIKRTPDGATAGGPPAAPPAPEEAECDRQRILIVDDEAAIRALFELILSSGLPGLRIDQAGNGQEAVLSFEKFHQAVLLMDLHMPQMDGRAAFEAVHRLCDVRGWEMPAVVFCTGFAPPDAVRRVVERESRHVLLSKPVSSHVLVEAVRSRLSCPGEGGGGLSRQGRRRSRTGMRIIRTVLAMREALLPARRAGRRIGFVPTMGALHEGHRSLLRRAASLADEVVVSIFVNPLQFGPREDLQAYPRDFDGDCRMCEQEGVTNVFAPPDEEMYAADHSTCVEESRLSAPLCGARRPGHFRGVATVVAKLFNIVQPDVAIFGQKDAQQARVIARMTRDLSFPVRIDVAPTVREADGLAMSSRNAYLTAEERREATCLIESLRLAQRLRREGVTDAALIRRRVTEHLGRFPRAQVEYVEILDDGSLEPVSRLSGPALAAVCVRIGKARLIDNAMLDAGG